MLLALIFKGFNGLVFAIARKPSPWTTIPLFEDDHHHHHTAIRRDCLARGGSRSWPPTRTKTPVRRVTKATPRQR
uniref:Putative secreted protein n=1 Tax=Anopheles darlingi TaxID=43151 RepID=A0A2M4DRD3_ANODA